MHGLKTAALTVAAVAAISAAPAAGQEVPETPAGRRLSQWLELINSPQAASAEAAYDTIMGEGPRQRRTRGAFRDMVLAMAAETRGLRLVRVVEQQAHELRVLLREGTGNEIVLWLRVGASPPHRVEEMRFLPANGGDRP